MQNNESWYKSDFTKLDAIIRRTLNTCHEMYKFPQISGLIYQTQSSCITLHYKIACKCCIRLFL